MRLSDRVDELIRELKEYYDEHNIEILDKLEDISSRAVDLESENQELKDEIDELKEKIMELKVD